MKTMYKVVVTGGQGFIGSHLVDTLVSHGYDVHVIDDKSAESNDVFYENKDAYYYNIDINDISIDNIDHFKIFKDAKYIFHLAAESRIVPSIENPIKAVMTNVIGTTKILEMCRKVKVKRIIYSSTSSVYGLDCPLPTTENTYINCLNPYSATKYSGEQIIQMYSKMFGVDACIFRYFNVFGERSPTKGQYAPVVGLFLNCLKNKKRLKIFGSGEKRRDFVHVKDVVAANMLAMRYMKPLNGEIFNIGSGENYSINEIASFISDKIDYLKERKGEAENTLADIKKAKTILGFSPKFNVKEWIHTQLI